MPNDRQPAPHRPRRWFQFSLSRLLGVVLMIAATVAWRREPILQWIESLSPRPPVVEPDDRYRRLEVLGPITTGGPPRALEPPREAEILAALARSHYGASLPKEGEWHDAHVTLEPIAEYVDAPRFYPILGQAQDHHMHYQCTVRYADATATTWIGRPLTRAITLSIDHHHFHVASPPEDEDADTEPSEAVR